MSNLSLCHHLRFSFLAIVTFSLCQTSSSFGLQESIARSIKDVRVLSPEWICVVVDPTEEILAERQARFGAELAVDQERFLAGKDTWYYSFSKGFRTLLVQQSYHLPLFAKFNQAEYWKVNNVTPADVTVWSHSVDGFPGESAADAPTSNSRSESRTADMVYLKLPTALQDGTTREVKGDDGRTGVLTFNDASTVCWSIKVNQSAYSSTATKKVAYLGMWLPGIGAMDFSAFVGKSFHLKKFVKGARWDGGSSAGEPVFTGTIAVRKKFSEQDVKRDGGSNLTGEDVYELDFSAFQGEGLYCIQIPGLGRSWPFEVTKGGYGTAFYTMMKGLYIQRCGMELKSPFTAWERPACHLESKQGDYISETADWYLNRYRQGGTNQNHVGFRDASGQRIGLSQFTLIGNSNSHSPVLAGVRGGWHDAADYDRRIYHYGVVSDLLAAFEAFPSHFGDSQLNMPESGNGIPDILDEAAYGLDVWRSTQRKEGAVSSWIEQESHPGHTTGNLKATFTANQLEMFVAIPDRASTYAYAAAASWLGRLLASYSPARSKDYLESAQRAYSWARDDTNTLRDRTFTIRQPMRDPKLKGTTIKFDEDPQFKAGDMAYADRAFAAANLYFATKDDTYLKDWTASGFGQRYPAFATGINPSQCMPLLLNPGLPPVEMAAMKQSMLMEADRLVASQNTNPYRMLWLSPGEGWFHAMAWGNFHKKARVLAVAYAVSRDPKYRASMENAADFFLGCNPLGSTLVTGIGSVYPVVIQHIHSLSDGIPDPTPGIAPYTLTFGISMRPFLVVDKGHPSVKTYFTNVALAFIPDKLGRKDIQASLDRFEKRGEWERAASANGRKAIWDNFPILRRKVIHPGAAVDQNEFTINETISPLALLFGALTAEKWMPPEELKHRQPRRKLEDLPFYSMP